MNREVDSFTRHCPLLLFAHVVRLVPYLCPIFMYRTCYLMSCGLAGNPTETLRLTGPNYLVVRSSYPYPSTRWTPAFGYFASCYHRTSREHPVRYRQYKRLSGM